MTTPWRTIGIGTSSEAAAAELVFVCGPPLLCFGVEALCARVLRAAQRISFTAAPGQSLDLLPDDEGSPRILALGVGEAAQVREDHWLAIGGYIHEVMLSHRLATVRLPTAATLEYPAMLEAVIMGALLHGLHRESAGSSPACFRPQRLMVAPSDLQYVRAAERRAAPVNRARAWVESPPNALTPPAWAEEATTLLTRCNAQVRVIEHHELELMGAGALTAVGRGSEHGARLFVAEWRGDARRSAYDVVMVGKGLTFDSGGLNLKNSQNIAKMKLDMGGGAAVLCALESAAARHCRANVVAIVPMVENVIDARAYRPGDVVTSLSGLEIEVVDTDAEGRLALADALCFGLRTYQPAWMVDLATMTTAVTRVLHEEFAALYASSDPLAQALLASAEAVGERLWRMPLDPCHDYLVESEVAQLRNTGAEGFFGFGSGSPTAGAKFLERFTSGTAWAHVDMTGTAWSTRRTSRCGKGATGYGVQLLDHWLATLEDGESY